MFLIHEVHISKDNPSQVLVHNVYTFRPLAFVLSWFLSFSSVNAISWTKIGCLTICWTICLLKSLSTFHVWLLWTAIFFVYWLKWSHCFMENMCRNGNYEASWKYSDWEMDKHHINHISEIYTITSNLPLISSKQSLFLFAGNCSVQYTSCPCWLSVYVLSSVKMWSTWSHLWNVNSLYILMNHVSLDPKQFMYSVVF